jgi:hypothetical protein
VIPDHRCPRKVKIRFNKSRVLAVETNKMFNYTLLANATGMFNKFVWKDIEHC